MSRSGGTLTPTDNTVTSAKIVDGAIVDADVNASAAIASSKLADGAPKRLDYKEGTADVATSSGAAQTADVTGCSSTVTVRAAFPTIAIEWGGYVYETVAGRNVSLDLYEDTVKIDEVLYYSSTANEIGTVWKVRERTPGAGSHTYKLVIRSGSSGVGHALGQASDPVILRISEVRT